MSFQGVDVHCNLFLPLEKSWSGSQESFVIFIKAHRFHK